MYRLILILVYIIAVEVKGHPRIVGGYDVPPGFGHFSASLQNLTGHHVCGGAIISQQYVVTAAHCVSGAQVEYIKVIVGTTDLDIGGLQYDVKSISIHHEFKTNSRLHDIAMIKISEMFDLQSVAIISLDNQALQENDWVILTGFGAQEPKGVSSRKMQSLRVPVFNQEVCRYAMRNSKRQVYDSMFCTFTRIGEGTCYGDSGGPLLKNNKLVGLVSWGIPCASGFPDVHTRIDVYIDWIHQIMGQH